MVLKIFRSLKEKFLFEFFIDSPITDKDYPDCVLISKSPDTGNSWQPQFLFDSSTNVYFVNKSIESDHRGTELKEKLKADDLSLIGRISLSNYSPKPGEEVFVYFTPEENLKQILTMEGYEGFGAQKEGEVPRISGLTSCMSGELQLIVKLSNDGRLKALEDHFWKTKEE